MEIHSLGLDFGTFTYRPLEEFFLSVCVIMHLFEVCFKILNTKMHCHTSKGEYLSSIQVLNRETGTYANDLIMKHTVLIAIYSTPQKLNVNC